MSILDKHKLHYEDLPRKQINITRKGGKVNKMTKASKEVKQPRVYAPSRMEVAKTIVIWILITAGIAFVSGMQYQNSRNAEMARAMKSVQITAPVVAPVAEDPAKK